MADYDSQTWRQPLSCSLTGFQHCRAGQARLSAGTPLNPQLVEDLIMGFFLVVTLITLIGPAVLTAALITIMACARSAQFTQAERRWHPPDLWSQ